MKGIDELARTHAPRAIEILNDVMETGVEDRDRLRAAEAILDRGYGKPSQAIIQIPASRRQAALLAGMSDEDLVAIIEQKQLPRLGGPQPVTTVAVANPVSRPLNRPAISSHMPEDESFDTPDTLETSVDIDPLLL